MKLIPEIAHWRSIRRFKAIPVEKEKIDAILEAGRLAPSWQNLQPWHFLVIANEKLKNELSQIVTTKKVVQKAPMLIAILGNIPD